MPDAASPTRAQFSIGLLGGGQLARMLALAGAPLGFQVAVLSGKSDDPAAQVTSHWKKGEATRSQDLEAFMAGLDAVTFESEFFDMDQVAQAADANPRLFVYPRPQLMSQLQDRRTQKAMLDRFKIPTSPWVKVDSLVDLRSAADQLGFPFVLKKAQGGYDGYGTFYVRNSADFAKLRETAPFPAIAEKTVKFKRELAVMMFRAKDGDTVVYPLVESRQTDSRCDFVLGPMKHPRLNPLIKKFTKALKDLNYVGALGIELFDTGGQLLVNELAPRVHNTGHYSQNLMNFDQFQLHLLCGRSGKLPKIELRAKAFVMANILGADEHLPNLHVPLTGALHWYGKAESRPGRKLGHVNYFGSTLLSLFKTARRERAGFFKRSSR